MTGWDLSVDAPLIATPDVRVASRVGSCGYYYGCGGTEDVPARTNWPGVGLSGDVLFGEPGKMPLAVTFAVRGSASTWDIDVPWREKGYRGGSLAAYADVGWLTRERVDDLRTVAPFFGFGGGAAATHLRADRVKPITAFAPHLHVGAGARIGSGPTRLRLELRAATTTRWDWWTGSFTVASGDLTWTEYAGQADVRLLAGASFR